MKEMVKKKKRETKITHHFHSAEDMAEMVAAFQILGDVSKCAEVIRVLSGAWNVPDLMLSHDGLVGQREEMSASNTRDGRDEHVRVFTLVAASMNLTPL